MNQRFRFKIVWYPSSAFRYYIHINIKDVDSIEEYLHERHINQTKSQYRGVRYLITKDFDCHTGNN